MTTEQALLVDALFRAVAAGTTDISSLLVMPEAEKLALAKPFLQAGSAETDVAIQTFDADAVRRRDALVAKDLAYDKLLTATAPTEPTSESAQPEVPS